MLKPGQDLFKFPTATTEALCLPWIILPVDLHWTYTFPSATGNESLHSGLYYAVRASVQQEQNTFFNVISITFLPFLHFRITLRPEKRWGTIQTHVQIHPASHHKSPRSQLCVSKRFAFSLNGLNLTVLF